MTNLKPRLRLIDLNELEEKQKYHELMGNNEDADAYREIIEGNYILIYPNKVPNFPI